jgi:hypothetical protein
MDILKKSGSRVAKSNTRMSTSRGRLPVFPACMKFYSFISIR